MTVSGGPKVVAVGGGHGLAGALGAARRYASEITAVVSVADDGGSSGRLVADLEILPPGDMRKCLVALAADQNIWSEALEYRFGSGDLAGHALGNVIMAGLAEVSGGFPEALDAMEALLGCDGRVLPATTEQVRLVAETERGLVTGQVAIANSGAGILEVGLDPPHPKAHEAAIDAITGADQVILGPGSLFTSVLPPLVVPQIRQAVAETDALRVYICNLVWQPGETDGMDAGDHLAALIRHGVEIDVMLFDPFAAGLPAGGVPPTGTTDTEIRCQGRDLASPSNPAHHDAEALAAALADLT